MKILDNNIGYVKWNRCIASDEALKKIKSALVFLEGCDYLIFDISINGGGDGRSNGFINQHLYANSEYQNLLVKRCKGEKEWHQSEVPYNYSDGPKFYDAPIYIITSKETGSAAEYFAFISQEMKRATILGEKTTGAGNPVTMVTIGDFYMYVPICEIKTIEGKSIEAKGVIPDIKIDPSLAMYHITKEILTQQLEKDNLSPEKKGLLQWQINYLNMKTNKKEVEFSEKLAGKYGEHEVDFKDGYLKWGKSKLLPFSDTVFYLENGYSKEGDLILEFDHPTNPSKLFYKVINENSGKVTKFELNKN